MDDGKVIPFFIWDGNQSDLGGTIFGKIENGKVVCHVFSVEPRTFELLQRYANDAKTFLTTSRNYSTIIDPPGQFASLDSWFVYYQECQKRGMRVTLK